MPDSCNNTDMPPVIEDYLEAISDTVVFLTAGCGVLFLLTLALFLDTLKYVMVNYTGTFPRLRTALILAVYPSLSLCAMLILIFPRSHLVLELIASLFVGLGLYNFITLVPEYFGSFEKMVECLQYDAVQFGSVPPCCCLLCCFWPVPLTEGTIAFLMALGLQYVCVMPIVGLATVVLWLDDKYDKGEMEVDNGYPYLLALTTLTTVCTLYGTHLFTKLTVRNAPHLNSLMPKLFTFKVILVLRNAQGAVFTQLAKNDVPDCKDKLTSEVRAESINQMLFVAEMFLLTIFCRAMYRSRQSSIIQPSDVAAVLSGNGQGSEGRGQYGQGSQSSQGKPHYGSTEGYR